ncbi:FIG01199889: hypothetical protein [hydrothermal vent metagenome]|uniref:DUF2062 domain-containing protein n=1 Tax=hydrothermal vent metagenome TaxID=652676 RepID=A0A3B1ABM7_9ZZZZ
MPKKFIQRWLPNPDKIRNHPHLHRIFGKLLNDPNLLHINRKSVSGAFFVGLFMAFVPVPIQMILAAAAAIWLRVNLPISVTLVWITNPLTIPPMFYFAYLVGTWILNVPAGEWHFELTLDWLTTELAPRWEPFLLGSFVCALVSGSLGYMLIRLLWRMNTVKQWSARKKRMRAKKKQT